MSANLTDADQEFLDQAINLSRHALEDQGKTPFGALLVIGEEVVASGTSSIVELHDPTAHAEVMALRNAGADCNNTSSQTAQCTRAASRAPCVSLLATGQDFHASYTAPLATM